MQLFTDEDFLDFTEALSDIFETNYVNGTQLWSWRNEGGVMRAWRYAPVPEDCQGPYSTEVAKEVTFSVDVHHEQGHIVYTLTFGDMGFILRFDSLDSLAQTMVGVVKSLNLSMKYKEVA